MTAGMGEWSRMGIKTATFFASPDFLFSAKLYICMLTTWTLSSFHYKKIINYNDPLISLKGRSIRHVTLEPHVALNCFTQCFSCWSGSFGQSSAPLPNGRPPFQPALLPFIPEISGGFLLAVGYMKFLGCSSCCREVWPVVTC